MAIEVRCRVAHGGLRASNEFESTKLEKFIGKEVKATISQERNPYFHKKFFALLRCVLDMTERYDNLETLRPVITVGAGHCTFIEMNGELVAVPKTINFAAMDDLAFSEFYQNALQYICTNILLEETPESIDLIISFI